MQLKNGRSVLPRPALSSRRSVGGTGVDTVRKGVSATRPGSHARGNDTRYLTCSMSPTGAPHVVRWVHYENRKQRTWRSVCEGGSTARRLARTRGKQLSAPRSVDSNSSNSSNSSSSSSSVIRDASAA
jgi:hypothetical protein